MDLARAPRFVILIVAYSITILIGMLDFANGDRFSLAPFYLPTISLVCWLVSLRAAVVLSFASAGIWLVVDKFAPKGLSLEFFEYWEALMRLLIFIAFAMLVARLRGALERERELARIDFLTGLYNSVAFYELAETEAARSRRYGRPFSLVFLDCDNFKAVNDSRGHQEGDQVLRAVAHCLRQSSRGTDLIARLGGDEFLLLLPETDEASAKVAVAKLRQQLEVAMRQGGWPVTFSIGVATFLNPIGTVSDMIREADDLMYSVKLSTKNGASHRLVG